jgi:hypothetical protein
VKLNTHNICLSDYGGKVFVIGRLTEDVYRVAFNKIAVDEVEIDTGFDTLPYWMFVDAGYLIPAYMRDLE